MRKYNPATVGARRRSGVSVPHDQAYATLTLPAAGELEWAVANRIIAQFMPLDVDLPFAIIRIPETPVPLYVRANQTRYALYTDGFENLPACWAVPYNGQVLDTEAVFELWSANDIPGSADISDIVLTISPRKQLSYLETAGEAYTATPYAIVSREYPVSLPI